MSDAIWWWWLGLVIGSFIIIQIYRIRKYGLRGTFSYSVMWRILFADHEEILHGRPMRKPRVFIYFIALAPFVWFLAHFGLGGRLG